MPAFLRLVERDRPVPSRLTLQNEAGDEIASTMAPAGEAAIRSAILLLARSETLRPDYHYCVINSVSDCAEIGGYNIGIAGGLSQSRRPAGDESWQSSWGRGAAAGSGAPRGR